MAGEDELERTESEAVLHTRRELGSSYDAALVESFADRIERAVEHRVEARLHQRGADRQADGAGRTRQFVLGIVSAGVGVPITIVPVMAAEQSPFAAVCATVVGWIGLVGVNAAHASTVTGRRRPS